MGDGADSNKEHTYEYVFVIVFWIKIKHVF